MGQFPLAMLVYLRVAHVPPAHVALFFARDLVGNSQYGTEIFERIRGLGAAQRMELTISSAECIHSSLSHVVRVIHEYS